MPEYPTLKKALKAEGKMKQIINDDGRVYKGEEIENIDVTLPKKVGINVSKDSIEWVLSKTKGDTLTNKIFMHAVAGMESKHGEHALTFGGASNGIWQMDKKRVVNGKVITPIFADLQERFKADKVHGKFKETVKILEDAINKEFPNMLEGRDFSFKDLKYEDLQIPLVSAVVVRLWLTTKGAESTYSGVDKSFDLWKDDYNTHIKYPDDEAKQKKERERLKRRWKQWFKKAQDQNWTGAGV